MHSDFEEWLERDFPNGRLTAIRARLITQGEYSDWALNEAVSELKEAYEAGYEKGYHEAYLANHG